MISVSDTFLEAIRLPHSLAVEAVAYPPSGDPVALPVSGGSVVVDRTAEHRRRLALELADPFLYPVATSDPVNVYGTEVVVKRGVRFGGGAVELVPLGVFRVEDATRDTPGGGFTLTGWDRSRQVKDQRFIKPRRFNAQSAVDLIELLISEVYSGAEFDVQTTDATQIPKHTVERDRWAEVVRVAKVIGCEVYPTETGVWRIQDAPDPRTATSVWTVDAGPGGVLVKASESVSREGAPNGIVVIGEPRNGSDAPVRGEAIDDDDASPTRWSGPYGKVPRFYASQLVRTQAQADRVAEKLLAEHLGVSRTVSFDSVPNPALEAGDAVTVVHPDGRREQHLIDALTIPLSPDGVLTGETRALDWGGE